MPSSAVLGLVRVDARPWPTPRRGPRPGRRPPSSRRRRCRRRRGGRRPAARGVQADGAPTVARSRWQVAVVVGPAHGGLSSQAGEERVALLDRQPARVAAPGRGVGQALVLGRAVEARGGARSRRTVPGSPARRGRHDAQRLERVAQHGVDLGAGLGLPRLVGLEVGVGLADEPPGGLEGDRRLHALPAPRPRPRRPRPRPRPAGCPGAARGRCRRTSSRRRWPPGTGGCRGCWRGRRCSARPCPRRRSRRRARTACRRRKW